MPAYTTLHAVSLKGNDFPNFNCFSLLKFNNNAMFFRACKNPERATGFRTRMLSIASEAHANSLRAYGQALLANQDATSHLCQSGRLSVRYA